MSAVLDARLCILDFLHRSPGGRSVQEILHHLHANTAWGEEQLASESGDQGLRSVQSWLKHLRESSAFAGFIDAKVDPTNRRRLRYLVVGGPSLRTAIPIEEALLLALAEKHLELVIPQELRAKALNDLFQRAQDTILRYESKLAGTRLAVGHYLRSVAVQSRGQALVARDDQHATFAVVSSALLHRCCIRATYHARERLLHPCAIVVRSPKLYLVASEDIRTAPASQQAMVPKTYAFHRLSQIHRHDEAAKTKQFDLQRFIRGQGLEAPLRTDEGAPGSAAIRLMMHLHPAPDGRHDSLLDDLERHPLHPDQTITPASDDTHHALCVDSIVPSEALVSWILGRLDRIEVVSPGWLRALIAKRVHTLQQRYRA